MRRLISIAAFALLMVLPLWAQRGGGHAGGGHFAGAGGHSGGFGGHVGGGHFGGGTHIGGGHLGGMRSGHGVSRGSLRASHGTFLHNGFRRRHHDGFFVRNRRFGFGGWGWGYPWWGYQPWLWDWWDDHSGDNSDYYNDLAIANQMNEQSLEQQRLRRQEEADGDQDAYAPRPQDRPNTSTQTSDARAATPLTLATVLVFRDGRKQEVQNYAIVGQTLWNFAPQHTEKISIAALDLDATVKANDERGVTFRLPGSTEGQ